ncbi:hypothetical protein [Fibrivirga algicola]|uniref:DUF1351 domain-containing protein n=1 Tax=Fibrivirga algicola TaxID=2950420 RepID=A0ABX0QAW1_9BACT|nr:hypothetical protein [Fibrivirga algicola]NID09410.1 hypothetical protein [Fibrivirga algicola]
MTTEVEAPIDAVVVEIIPTAKLAEIQPDTDELATVNATDAGLAVLLAKAEELAAIGAPDKASYDHIHAVTMVAVKVRTGAKKLAKELAAPHKDEYDKIIGEGERIGAEAKKAEDLLRPIKEDYEESEKRRKIAEAKAEADKIQSRISSLIRQGATYEAGSYLLGDVVIDNIEVQAATDEVWQTLFTSVVVEAEKIAVAQREAEAKKQAEAEALEKQRQEQERQQQLLDAQAKKQREEAEAQRVAMEKQQAELRQQVLDMRLEKLTGLGWETNGKRVWYSEYASYPHTDIVNWSATAFSEMVDQFWAWENERIGKAAAAQREQEEIAERERQLSTRFRERSALLVAEGWQWDEEGDVCSNGQAWSITLEDLRDIDDEGFNNLLAGFRQWVLNQAEAAKQAEADAKAKQKADKERAKRLKPDKDRLSKWSANLASYTLAVTNQPETTELQNQFIVRLAALAQEFIEEVEAL